MMLLLGAWLLMLNLVALAAMGWDKHLAKQGRRRIPERTLLLLALVGGSLGELLGIYLFRHKTRHPRFCWGVPLMLAAQLALACWLLS